MINNCPKCGNEFERGIKFCQSCGCNLTLEFIENPICPQCKTSYTTNTKFCVNDGSKLVSRQDLIPKCVICNTSYSEEIKFCPIDGGEVKIMISRQFGQPNFTYPQYSHRLFINQKYPKASISNRFLASLIDGLISLGLGIPAIIFFIFGFNKLSSYNENDGAVGLIFTGFLFYLIPITYTLIKDGLNQGQSFGKKSLNLMVVNLETNKPCDKGKSFFRNLISGIIIIIPFVGWLIEPILVLVTEDGRKLGDKAASTQVIDLKNF